jgi:hypothetical protein
VWPKQVKGLTEGMGVGVGQMVFGTVRIFIFFFVECDDDAKVVV